MACLLVLRITVSSSILVSLVKDPVINSPSFNALRTGKEVINHLVVSGDNCYELSTKYSVSYDDIQNTRTGLTCATHTALIIGDVLNICKTSDTQGSNSTTLANMSELLSFNCNGPSLLHAVVEEENCYDLAVQFEVEFPDIFNSRSQKTCDEDNTLYVGDVLLICNGVEPPKEPFQCDSGE